MNHSFMRFAVGIMALYCCIASAQQAPQPQDTSPPLNEADKRTVAQITKLQQRIERLENEIETRQAKVEALANTLSASAQTSLFTPKVAKVVLTHATAVFINAGIKGDGFRRDDQVIFVRRESSSLRLVGKGRVAPAYPTDAVCVTTENYGIRPDDEVYVSNRSGSPYSNNRVRF